MLLLLLLPAFLPSSSASCPLGQAASARDGACVEAWAFLLGGEAQGWKSDAEVWSSEERQPINITSFPYTIDAPFGWWSPGSGLLVCGGKNWEDDQVESRCWQYSPCLDSGGSVGSWLPRTPLPHALSGGSSVVSAREELWALGGGDGQTASGRTQVLRQNSTSKEWVWGEGPSLNRPRYGHCTVQLGEEVLVLGGHDDAGILDSVEVFNPTTNQVEEVSTTSTHLPLMWGSTCWPHGEGVLLAGGMNSFFMPRPYTFHLSYPGLEWTPGPQLPWSSSGALGASMGPGGQPMLWGGFGMGYHLQDVLRLGEGLDWLELDTELEHSRVSGISVTVPSDLWAGCP